ncbi:MAG: NAD-dependent epimerase/dehydratase family protein [Emcibacter sp.]|nr:NAD-dependent epimerase/dehydratase family protein [Emcibacter sp.]
MSGKKVAITGATGFLGYHVLQALLASGHTPVAVVRDLASAKRRLPYQIEIRQADIMNLDDLVKAFEGVDAAIHLAGKVSVNKHDDKDVFRVNVTGAQNFLEAVAQTGVRRALFTSTTSAVGALSHDHPEAALDETSHFNLDAVQVAYIQAKRQAHEMALKARNGGTPVVVLSPSFILGPEDINSNTTVLVDAVRGQRLPICPDGGVNPIDVRDCAAAYVTALDHPDPAPHYILASPHNMPLKNFVNQVADLAQTSPPHISLPFWLVLQIANIVELFVPEGELTAAGAQLGSYYWYFNAETARRDLSLKCRPLDDTLKATFDWLDSKENGKKKKHKQEKK